MKFLEWEKEIKKLDGNKKDKMIKALETLLNWNTFEKEYGWTRLSTLRIMLKANRYKMKTAKYRFDDACRQVFEYNKKQKCYSFIGSYFVFGINKKMSEKKQIQIIEEQFRREQNDN